MRKGWLSVIPVSFVSALILAVCCSDGVSLLWMAGALSVAGCMLLVLQDNSFGRKYSKLIYLVQAVLLVLSALVPEVSADGGLNPRLVVFSFATAAAMCASLLVSLFARCGDANFLLGEYRGKDFVLDAMRIVYSMLLIMVLLAVALTDGARPLLRDIVAIVGVLLAALLFGLVLVRFLSMYSIEKAREEAEAPTEGDIQLFRHVQGFLDDGQKFLDCNLTVDEICRRLGTNRCYISRSVNACTGFSVPRYINNKRVQYAKDLYTRNMSLKVSELALLSGFGSGVTFNTAFRLETGISPRDWCRDQRDRAALEQQRPSKSGEQEPEP